MNTNISNIQSVSDCDALLELFNGIKADLERDRAEAGMDQQKLTYSATDLDQKIAFVTADLATVNAHIATMPEGHAKEMEVGKKLRLELKLYVYNLRIDNYGLMALVESDLEYERIDAELQRVITFIADLEARKIELAS